MRVGLSGGALWTDISVEGKKTRLREPTLSASVGVQLSPRLTLLGGAVALLGGAVGEAGFDGGALAVVGASYRALAPNGATPLVSVAVTAAAALARVAGDAFTSTDLKLSVTAAWPVARDRYHYQVIAGATVALPRGLDLFIEGSPVGARSLSGGVGLSY